MSEFHGSEWSPSEWYRYKATPTHKKLIKRHIENKHTEYCMTYDVNWHGTYCKWLTDVFWPKIYFAKNIDLVTKDTLNNSKEES